MTAFANCADMLTRYDFRVIGQLLSDTGTALDEASLLASDTLVALLEDASGQIVSFAVKGERYIEADLQALTGNGLAILKRWTCDLAYSYVVMRRGLPVEDYPQAATALDMLTELSHGKIIFPIAANAEAGHTASLPITIQTIAGQNFLTNDVRYFPTPRFTTQQLGS